MRLLYSFFIFCLALSASATLLAQAPANDLCTNATAISCGETRSGTTVNSTQQTAPNSCGSEYGVWYTFTGTGDPSVITATPTSSFDLRLSIFATSGGCSGNLTQIQCRDLSVGTETVSFTTMDAQEYLIYIADYRNPGSSTATGSFDLSVTCFPPAANDECSAATMVTVNPSENCLTSAAGTISGATASGEITSCAGTENDDVWFTFMATSTTHAISITNVSGTPTDLVHNVHTGSCGALTQVNCSDPNTSTVSGLNIGQTYYLQVASYFTNANPNTTFDVCITTPPPPPANDNCSAAIELPLSADDACSASISGTTVLATRSTETTLCSTFSNDDDVWYFFTPTTSGKFFFNTSNTTSTAYVNIYSGSCAGGLTSVGNSCFTASNEATLTANQTYLVQVYTSSSSTTTRTTFDLCVYPAPPPPANNACVDAQPITSGVPITGSTATATNVEALSPCSGGLLGSSCASDLNDGTISFNIGVWFSYTSTSPGDITITTDGSSFDTELQVFLATGGDCSNLVCVAGDDDSGEGTRSTVCFSSSAARSAAPAEYLIYLDGDSNGAVGDFTISLTDSALPVAFADFHGKTMEKVNMLEWTTASEENTELHRLERSLNGSDRWHTVAEVAATGQPNLAVTYSVADDAPTQIAYYRVRSFDFDGYETASPIVRLERQTTGDAILRAFPVPAGDRLTIEFSLANNSDVQLSLLNSLGQQQRQLHRPADAGINRQELNLEGLPMGIYFVRLEVGDRQQLYRVVKR